MSGTKMKRFFVTGTDTDVGKTLVSVALLECLKQKGLRTAALKPVAAGCEYGMDESGNNILLNEDALALQRAITENLPYTSINPLALAPAIAPHIAASQIKQTLTAEGLIKECEKVLNVDCDALLIEGAGGWRVPLNESETLADFAQILDAPVILVVGVRLGCISHAILTAEAIIRDGLNVVAWVANQVDADMPVAEENIATLKERFDFPFLGHIPFLSKPSEIDTSKFLDIDKILED